MSRNSLKLTTAGASHAMHAAFMPPKPLHPHAPRRLQLDDDLILLLPSRLALCGLSSLET